MTRSARDPTAPPWIAAFYHGLRLLRDARRRPPGRPAVDRDGARSLPPPVVVGHAKSEVQAHVPVVPRPGPRDPPPPPGRRDRPRGLRRRARRRGRGGPRAEARRVAEARPPPRRQGRFDRPRPQPPARPRRLAGPHGGRPREADRADPAQARRTGRGRDARARRGCARPRHSSADRHRTRTRRQARPVRRPRPCPRYRHRRGPRAGRRRAAALDAQERRDGREDGLAGGRFLRAIASGPGRGAGEVRPLARPRRGGGLRPGRCVRAGRSRRARPRNPGRPARRGVGPGHHPRSRRSATGPCLPGKRRRKGWRPGAAHDGWRRAGALPPLPGVRGRRGLRSREEGP